MLAEISSAITSVQVALDIAKAANGLSNYNELVSAVSQVHTKLIEANTVTLASQEKQSALSKRVSKLEKQLLDIENWESNLKNYKLHKFATGSLAYVYEPTVQSTER